MELCIAVKIHDAPVPEYSQSKGKQKQTQERPGLLILYQIAGINFLDLGLLLQTQKRYRGNKQQ